MTRKNRSPEENVRREKIRELLQMANIDSMDDIQNLFKETIAEFMEKGLEAELDDELGYSKYDYKNKDTDNSRNGHSSKRLRTSFGDVDVSVPRDRRGEFEPQVLKKNQTSISQDIEEKILSMYAKGMTTFGHDGYYEKVDWTTAGLEPDPRPDGHLLCRTYARVTPPWPDVKGKMNCSSTHLTSDPTGVMLFTRQQPDSTATARNKFCSICTPNGVYTEFGIDPIFLIIA